MSATLAGPLLCAGTHDCAEAFVGDALAALTLEAADEVGSFDACEATMLSWMKRLVENDGAGDDVSCGLTDDSRAAPKSDAANARAKRTRRGCRGRGGKGKKGAHRGEE